MLKRLILRIVTAVGCLCGNHTYSPALMQFTTVDQSDRYGTYRVETDCIWCGKHYFSLVRIPMPTKEELEAALGGDGDADIS